MTLLRPFDLILLIFIFPRQPKSALMIQYVAVGTIIMEIAWAEIWSPAFHLLWFVPNAADSLQSNISLGTHVDNMIGATYKTSATVPSLVGPKEAPCAIRVAKPVAALFFWFIPRSGPLEIAQLECDASNRH
jgi:hypothetical protein